MHRLSNSTQINTAPTAPAVLGTPGYPTEGDPASGIPASEIDAWQAYTIQEELAHVVEASGIALDKTNPHQLLTALGTLYQSALGFTPVKQGLGNDGETHAVTLAWNPSQPHAGDARLQLLVDNGAIGNVVTDLKGTVTASGAYVEIPLFGSVRMLIQAGVSATGPDGNQTINFPEAFGTALIASFACVRGATAGSTGTVAVGAPTTNPLVTMAVVSSTGGTLPFSWLAVGMS